MPFLWTKSIPASRARSPKIGGVGAWVAFGAGAGASPSPSPASPSTARLRPPARRRLRRAIGSAPAGAPRGRPAGRRRPRLDGDDLAVPGDRPGERLARPGGPGDLDPVDRRRVAQSEVERQDAVREVARL